MSVRRTIDGTHRADLPCWVASARAAGTDFPIQNLPFGVFSTREDRAPRVGVAIGDQILDVAALVKGELLAGEAFEIAARCVGGSLNRLMELPTASWTALRRALSDVLRSDTESGRRAAAAWREILVPQHEATMHLPAEVGDYTDFYASIHHATNVGSMFRPDNPLLPNYKWVPIGYHGRASSLVPSGTAVRRPMGQLQAGDAPPAFAASARLDYECEVGMFVGGGNALGTAIPLAEAEGHVFGLCLVNDWSARDVQAWEYQPLGPFLAKNFATTVSPWVVTLDALAPFRAPAFARAEGDPQPLPYLNDADDRAHGGIGIALEVSLSTERMRREGIPPARLSRGRFTDMYWTMAQLLTHHASNGCNLRPGDLLASGTVSGTAKESRGCLLELTWRGTEPITLPTGEERRFLEDGDEVIMAGRCEADGFIGIGFGECRGVVLGAG